MPLIWPGSDETEEPRDPNEVKFRDGKRLVAPYIAVLLGSYDTERMTYEEAIAAMNRGLVADNLNRVYDRVVEAHRNRST